MSISASIDLKLYSKIINFTTIELINILISNGWNILDYCSKTYLPIGDTGEFNWQSSSAITDNEIIEICQKKFINQEVIGLVLTWLDTNIGGEILFYPDGNISMILNLNRIKNQSTDLTDFDWYLSKIIPCLNKHYIEVYSVICEHSYM
ncbi:hypothetical protein, partial [Moraxella nonliquefaciens]|jgi:identified by metaGeneAnnotator|uniref:hypothetical protein n=1 Tax=Moraxella nonliquefaciens TaxID=478 RepID=UPI001EF52853